MANTVVAKGYVNIRDEKEAAGAITPGHLVQRNSAGKVVVHATAGGPVNKLFALEDAYQGKKITDAYASGDTAILWHPVSGEQVNAIAGGTIAVGDFVESNGDGTLRKYTVTSAGVSEFPASIVGVALEAASLGGRFTVEIL